jgi:hypothetical protein
VSVSSSSSISEFSKSSAQAASWRINFRTPALEDTCRGTDGFDLCLPSGLVVVGAASPMDSDCDGFGRASASREIFESGKRRESTWVSPIERIGDDLTETLFDDAETSVLEPCLGSTGTLLKENAGVGRFDCEVLLIAVALAGFVGLVRVCLAVAEMSELSSFFVVKEFCCNAFLGDCRRTPALDARGGSSVASSGNSSSDVPSMVV